MRIYTKRHIEEKAAKDHQRKIEDRGGFSRHHYLSEPYKGHMGSWFVTYWFRDKIEKGDKVRLKKETFTDIKPKFYLEFKDKVGVVRGSKWYSKHPGGAVFTLHVDFPDGTFLETNDYHWEKVE